MKLILIVLVLSVLQVEMLKGQNEEIFYSQCDACPQGINQNDSLGVALYEYNNSLPFITEDIESDFDIRRAGGNTRWHKGLDFRNHGAGADQMRGSSIRSLSDGIISAMDATGYKYVIINDEDFDLGYGHIFSHNDVDNSSSFRSGNFVLKMTEANAEFERFPAIIDLGNCIAYSTEVGEIVILGENDHCQDTLATTNQIATGADFAPIGGSRNSATRDFPAHLYNPAALTPLFLQADPPSQRVLYEGRQT